MSGFVDSCKSNMDSDSISNDYNTLDSRKLTPTAPPMGHGGSPQPSSSASSSSAKGSYRLYPELHSDDQSTSSWQDTSECTSLTLKDFVYVRELSLPVTDNYASAVVRVGELSYSDEKVMGMVFVAPFLYAVHRNSNVLYKSDTTYANHRGFIAPPMSSHSISGLVYPRGMAANHRTKHLYITDRHMSKGLLLKVTTTTGAVVAHGDLPGIEPFGVSVAPSNESVIVACCRNPCGGVVRMQIASAGFVAIFEDMGDRLREQQRISLQESIQVPRHVLEAPKSSGSGRGKEYLVVHGWIQLPGIECDHQVSRVNGDGRIVRSFGAGHGKTERHLNRPMSISFDDCDKMFVADSFNDRVLLLNRLPSESYDLELVRPLVTKANGLSKPRHVCLDSVKRLLYVGKESGHIDVFYVGGETKDASQPSETTEKKS